MIKDIWAVVPVKRFADAKSRLAPVLGSHERGELARVMFEDVLDVLMQCDGVLAGTIVVTADLDAAAIGRRRGATVLLENEDGGINAAVRGAVARLEPSAGIVIVPSDIPQLSPSAVAMAADLISKPQTLAIAAASKDGGTNLLACRPASAVPLHFGVQSHFEHMRTAQQSRLSVSVLPMPELMLDIDTPEDLEGFQMLHTTTRTHAFLSQVPFGVRRAGVLATEGGL